MAKQGSKGLTKRHSKSQKARYKAHYFKLMDNKIARLARHVRRNANEVRRKAARRHSRKIKIDHQAVRRLEELRAGGSSLPASVDVG